MKKTPWKKVVVIGIIFLFLCVNLASGDKKSVSDSVEKAIVPITQTNEIEKTYPLTLSIYGKTGITQQTISVSLDDVTKLLRLTTELEHSMTVYQSSQKTQQLQQELLGLLDERNALPKDVSKDELLPLLQPPRTNPLQLSRNFAPLQSKASEFFCNFVTTGSGSAFPIIILPRLIPFLLTPIPRAFVLWSTPEGITSVGGLISRTGFMAGGQQKGIALGFWGIGFSVFLPPVMAYGLFGYALFARVTAEYIEFYPPNTTPEITQTDPADGQQMVPISTSELRFAIHDADGETMSYKVTTEPNIGGGSGGLKPDGTYSVSISGLEDLTTYTWYIEVTDGKDIMEKTLTFTTEAVAPILTNPSPPDGERDVPIDLSELKFTLNDYQGDAMEYTVETSPGIGAAHVIGIHDGTYTIAVSGLTYGATYAWYVNVTDGEYWTRKVFSFETRYPSQFDPFEYGWQYRKQIIIDHTQILEDQTHFPMLISLTDADLHQKAQSDGGDIMFMNDIGVSTRVYHDLESYTSASGALLAWVDIPLLSSANDTVFYMYYGNPACINQAYPKKTWDSHFEAVWHMNDATLMTIKDSTSNAYTGTKISPNEPQQSTGKVGPCQDFDGTNDYIQFTESVIPLGQKTISAWMNRHSTGKFGVVFASSTGIASSDAGTSWAFIGENDTVQCVLGNGGDSGHYMRIWVPHPNINSWHYYTMTYDDTSLKVYIDGALVGSTTMKSGSEANPSYDLRIGETNHPSYDYYLDAGLDEMQVSNVARSEAWIQTSYTTMNNPGLFLTLGPEVPGP